MEALTQENRAKVVLAERESPTAMAAAFRSGRLGVMDYYNLRNVQADTKMRDELAQSMEAVEDQDTLGDGSPNE